MACIQKVVSVSLLTRPSPIIGSLSAFRPLTRCLQLLQVEAEVLLAVGEFLGAQQLHRLLGGLGVVRVGVVHGDALEDRVDGKSRRSLKAYLVSSRWPRMMCASWKARMAFRLPICCAPSWVTTLVVSIRLLERMMVLPTASDSSGSVSRVRTRMGRLRR
jgi:hypothetical protein